MQRIIDNQDREALLNNDTFLGTREITVDVKKKGASNMTRVVYGGYDFLSRHRPAIYPSDVSYKKMEETVSSLWMQVRDVGNRYVKEHITKLDPQPPTWTALEDKKYHIAVFEKIVYSWSRTDDGVSPVDILDPKREEMPLLE
jgi:hypothetical protein